MRNKKLVFRNSKMASNTNSSSGSSNSSSSNNGNNGSGSRITTQASAQPPLSLQESDLASVEQRQQPEPLSSPKVDASDLIPEIPEIEQVQEKSPLPYTDELVRRLSNLKSIIEKLYHSLPGSSGPIVERKLNHFEEMIAEFPAGCTDQADEWRDKVVGLWQRFLTDGKFNPVVVAVAPVVATASIQSSPSRKPISKLSANAAPHVLTSKLSTAGSTPKKATSSPICSYQQTGLLPKPITILTNPKHHQQQQQPLMQTKSCPNSPYQRNPSTGTASSTASSDSTASNQSRTSTLDLADMTQVLIPLLPTKEDLRKQSIRTELEQMFAKLGDIQSGSDVEAVKQLLIESARARQQILPYEGDLKFQFEIFNFAFRKLCSKMREQFLTIYGVRTYGINLKNLIAFLQAEIVAQHNKTVWLLTMMSSENSYNPNHSNQQQHMIMNTQKQQNQSKPRESKQQRESINSSSSAKKMAAAVVAAAAAVSKSHSKSSSCNSSSNFCNYCKTTGHSPPTCPSIKELLCFQCYQNGHTKKACTNVPFV